MDKLQEALQDKMRTDIPPFGPGDSIDVHVRVREGEKERIQVFSGVVIQRKGSGVNATFTVRKISNRVGVERIFPLHSANVDKIVVKRQGKVRRARLYYLRDRVGKAARIKEKPRH